MYPNLYYAFQDLFGVNIPFLKVFQTFGFFVAVAFLAAAYVLTKELQRRERLGLMKPVRETVVVGKQITTMDIVLSAVIWFAVGYKVSGIFGLGEDADYRAYILSLQGNIIGGLIIGGIAGFMRYRKAKKTNGNVQKVKTEKDIWPHQRVPDFTVLAAVAGLVGAKIFHNLENFGEFLQDPVGSLFSSGGLTFYGGLILASYVILRYAKKKEISLRHLIDSAAPALMLAYAIGRMGCQFSGDGDWGIYNSAYVTDINGKAVQVAPAQFQETLQKNTTFFMRQYGSLENIPHAAFPKPNSLSFLPDWFFAYSYPHNVIHEGVALPNCSGEYCNALPVPVYPTPLYEIITCLLLFGVLWAIRKKIKIPGVIFGIYLIFVGLERFFVELIRVNTTYDFLPLKPTQAEIISVVLILGGAIWIAVCRKKHQQNIAS
ncbi:prolipoprotein diacylglyceryltransferase [Chitinophaga skermanii]|uniref:Prolipoprotein diacylglyceryltransferase n=1 Tax=Chitinophaga skermanii TaxID=331697 RepID=A0A327QD54_9BACT|nr:prolipoprotein diacylglyceryl transferase family protein [Chitinophaga skermanii]RAJ02231.1 prolipoprotein diacylglyceryltransferase [Chitinophaga skermanii]